jgi:dipeptidyl aminopeptidase/acylaminoacyl peptidase
MGKKLDASTNSKREQESEKLMELYESYAKFYEIPSGIDLYDITEKLLQSSLVKDTQKASILNFKRKIIIFTYPSDELRIKGVVSYIPNSQTNSLLIFLRGGNRIFGIPNPASDLMCLDHYTIISSMYRDGVSEGRDQYGGDDVNDVLNLIDFLPTLERKIHINLQNSQRYLLGTSRGGMQMFLALARFPHLQRSFKKVVSLSGLLNMDICIVDRPDLKEMFTNDFGFIEGVNDIEWINKRNPLLTVNNIKKDLPILIIQGNKDNRVTCEEGLSMLNKLKSSGNNVTYLEVEGAEHCLRNIPDRAQIIRQWLEESSTGKS